MEFYIAYHIFCILAMIGFVASDKDYKEMDKGSKIIIFIFIVILLPSILLPVFFGSAIAKTE